MLILAGIRADQITDNALIRMRPCAKMSWLSLMWSEMGSQDAFHPGVLHKHCWHQQEQSSEATSPDPEPAGKGRAREGALYAVYCDFRAPEPPYAVSLLSSEDKWSARKPENSPGEAASSFLIANPSFSFSKVPWKSPLLTTLHLGVLSCFNTHLIKFSRMIKVPVIFFLLWGSKGGKKPNAWVYLKSFWILIIANVF